MIERGYEAFFNAAAARLPLGLKIKETHRNHSFRITNDADVTIARGWIESTRYAGMRYFMSGDKFPLHGGRRRENHTHWRGSISAILDFGMAYVRDDTAYEAKRRERAVALDNLKARPYRGLLPGPGHYAIPHFINAFALEAYVGGFRSENSTYNDQLQAEVLRIEARLSDDLWYWINNWAWGAELAALAPKDES
jgi:hypothetical protein